jgi:hypothetical protein
MLKSLAAPSSQMAREDGMDLDGESAIRGRYADRVLPWTSRASTEFLEQNDEMFPSRSGPACLTGVQDRFVRM